MCGAVGPCSEGSCAKMVGMGEPISPTNAAVDLRTIPRDSRLVVRPGNQKITWPKGGFGPSVLNKVMPWFEAFWVKHKAYPKRDSIEQEFGFSQTQISEMESSKLFLKSLERRGIPAPSAVDPFSGKPLGLTDRQLAAIAILTNYHDQRAPVARLSMLGVSEQELQGWMSSEIFRAELQSRADEAFDNVGVDATVNLARHVKNGNLNAIKFYFEVTGRAQSPEEVNVKQAMNILIEAVQKHVKDSSVLKAIADEVAEQRAMKGL